MSNHVHLAYHGGVAPEIILLDDLPEKRFGSHIRVALLSDPPEPDDPVKLGPLAWVNAGEVGCALSPKPEECKRYKARGILLVPRELPPFGARLRRIPHKFGKPVSCRIMVEFRVNGPLNLNLWKQLKLPKPWKKSPRNKWKNTNHYPVRLYSYQPAELLKDQVEFLQAQIALMELVA